MSSWLGWGESGCWLSDGDTYYGNFLNHSAVILDIELVLDIYTLGAQPIIWSAPAPLRWEDELHSLQWHRYKWGLQPTSAGYRKLVIGTQTRIISTGTISLIILICEIFYIIFKDTLKNNAKAGNKMSNVCHQVFENTSTFE